MIRLGMASDNVLRRFEAERQALAMMNHDNIAKIYEAGITEQGQRRRRRRYVVVSYINAKEALIEVFIIAGQQSRAFTGLRGSTTKHC